MVGVFGIWKLREVNNMNGYQPEKKCTKCLAFNICKKKHKNQVCKKYKECRPAPPRTGSNAQTPTYTPPPMPEVKAPKQRTILSVRDFAILLSLADREISRMQRDNSYMFFNETEEEHQKRMEEKMKMLQSDPHYQDLLRIREKLGELNIEVETPSVEVEE